MFSITIRERSGQVYTFHFDKPEVLIGRVKGNDVILPKQNISKRHAVVRSQGARFVVEDLGSTNGTYVNGHRIAAAVEIGPDDKVYLGDFVMNFLDLSASADQGPGDAPPVPGMPDLPDFDGLGQGFGPTAEPGVRETAMSPLEPLEDLGGKSNAQTSTSLPQAQFAGGGLEGEPQPLFDDQMDLSALETYAPAAGEVPDFNLDDLGLAGDPLPLPPAPIPSSLVIPAPPPVQVPSSVKSPSEATQSNDAAGESRATGSVSGLTDALQARASSPSLAAQVPGLAGALKMPPPADAGPSALTAGGAASKGLGDNAVVKRTAQYEKSPIAPPPPQELPPPGHFDVLAVLYRSAVAELRSLLPSDAAQMSDAEWTKMEDRVIAFVDQAARQGQIGAGADLALIKRDLIYELAGLGPLEPMLDDAAVESIEINGHTQIFVFRGGNRVLVAERFSCQQALLAAVDRLVRATGNPAQRGSLNADGTLVDGTTVRVVWPPLCPAGPAVLLRKPRTESPSLDQLIERGSVSAKAGAVLKYLVADRRSIAICGAPNVGRRTVVNALGQLIDPQERIVVVEDGQRLRLAQPHMLRLDSAASVDAGTSTLQVARRLMPDRLLLGECLSLSTAELFTVAADGLPPWIGSFHAKTIDDFVERATHAMVIRFPGIPENVAKSRVTRAVDAVACFEYDHEAGREVLRAVAVLNTTGFGPPFKWLSPEDFEGARA